MSIVISFLVGLVVGVVGLVLLAKNNDDIAEKLMGDDFFLTLYEVAVEEIREEIYKNKCTCGENEACSECPEEE